MDMWDALGAGRPGYGVLFQHFSEHTSRAQILEGARLLERLGFDSLWVRDHLIFVPYDWESQDLTFVDPILTLTMAATVTERIVLGAAAYIPHRHPIHTAMLLASLDFVAGPGRVIAGWGLGAYDKEFAAAGMGDWDRRELAREQVEVMRRLWTGEPVSHAGKYYQFEDVVIRPRPSSGGIPFTYCGKSKAAVRRAVEYCDGWGPVSVPRRDYRARAALARRLAEETGRPMPRLFATMVLSPGRTVEAGLARIDFGKMLAEANRRYHPPAYTLPPTGRYETLEDLDGSVVAGPAERIVEEVRQCQAAGAQHIVFDLRARTADWLECVQLLGEEVLPELRRGG